MAKYLFFTYGEPGWRGVQMRAIRIAEYFPKEEILFWNLYDSSFIEESGFHVETKHPSFISPKDVVFPDSIETIIFADLPTNEPLQYCVFKAAQLQNKKIVVCEQLYRKGQAQETVFKRIADQSDLFLMNALSSFKSDETDVVKVIPPQIETKPGDKSEIFKKYNIPQNARLVFGSGYNDEIYKKITEVAHTLSQKDKSIYTIISSNSVIPAEARIQGINKLDVSATSGPEMANPPSSQRENIITIPFVSGDDYFQLLAASDIVLVKFGFLQILEALALHKPTFVLGEAGYLLQNEKVIDPLLKSPLHLDLQTPDAFASAIEQLLSNSELYRKEVESLKQLHDGSLFGAKVAAEYIQDMKQKEKVEKSNLKLAILINEEVFEKQLWLQKQTDILPLSFFMAVPQDKQVIKRFPPDIRAKTIADLQTVSDEILPHSFQQVLVFSQRKLDGLTDLNSWTTSWIETLKGHISECDELYISDLGLSFFKSVIESCNVMDKVKPI